MYGELISDFEKKCAYSKNEEDVRIETNQLLYELSKKLNLSLNKNSEVTLLQGGRVDTIFSNIFFEFKTPNKFKNRKGIDEALYGRDDSDRGIFHYLINKSIESNIISNDEFKSSLKSKIGVGFDGSVFLFCRFKDSPKKLNIFDSNKTNFLPEDVNPIQNLDFEVDIIHDFKKGFKRLLLYIRSINRKNLSAEELLKSFSNKSEITHKYIPYLYNLLNENLGINSQVKTLFDEWNRIFGDIYGEETDFVKYSEDLKDMYNLPEDVEIRKGLFVLQTYYSIVTKLLIHNLLESLSNPTLLSSKIDSPRKIKALFSGDLYSDYHIENFFEIHFFEWFILTENLDINLINEINSEINLFETTASIIKPETVEDALKNIYIELIPKSLRKLMGEYYTPNWLVDFTIDKSGYDFGFETSVLDPTCGSGTFLIHIIKKFREIYKNEKENEEIINAIIRNVVGFDINPIAVISSKANYILALGDITLLNKPLTIPIYMCDSILVPTVHAKQKEQNHSILINTVVGEFELPVFNKREDNDYFLKKASNCVLRTYGFDEFYSVLINENKINITHNQKEVSKAFYTKLLNLHKEGKNGFWPIILKNSFAPLFMQDKFDYLIGNPPWISWKAMSDTYRNLTLDIWLSYGIFEKNNYDKITTHDDFAMAVVYVSIDHYLKFNGNACFILPQTFVKSSKGGEGFRKLKITRDSLDVNFAISEVYDMETIKPFSPIASNKTSVYLFSKNKAMSYPMHNYFVCENKNEKIKYFDSYKVAMEKMRFTQLSAKPINENLRSPWLTIEKNFLNNINKYLGKSPYRGRKGVEPCGAKGIYLVNIIGEDGKYIIIKNLIERSRLAKAKEYGSIKGIVEKDLIYPMIGGRNFNKWGVDSYLYIVLPHNNSGNASYRGIPERDLRKTFNKTYDWLFIFRDLLLETRLRNGKRFKEGYEKGAFPFYRLDNVGDYTFSPYKVLWKEQSKKMVSVVISRVNDNYLGNKHLIPDSKVLFVPIFDKNEAYYLSAILNSKIISEIVEAYTIDTQRGVDVVKNIKIPKYDDDNDIHKKIAQLSLKAHKLYYLDKSKIESIEDEIETYVLDIF